MSIPVGNTAWNGFCSGVHNIAKGVGKGAQRLVNDITLVKNDSDALFSALRFCGNIITGLEHLNPSITAAGKFNTTINNTLAVIDAAQVVGDISYFANHEFEGARPMSVASKSTFATADVVGLAGWFGDLGFFETAAIWDTCVDYCEKGVNLVTNGKISKFLGKHDVFGTIRGFSLGGFLTGVVGVAFIFGAADNIHTLVKPDGVSPKANKAIRTKAALDLVKNITEVALRTLMIVATIVAIASTAYVATAVALGIFAATIGITSFLYHQGNKKLIPS